MKKKELMKEIRNIDGVYKAFSSIGKELWQGREIVKVVIYLESKDNKKLEPENDPPE